MFGLLIHEGWVYERRRYGLVTSWIRRWRV